jgi:hypothetical protein
MRTQKIQGQELVVVPTYPNNQLERLVATSSVGVHLWIGGQHHLNRNEVKQLIKKLQKWVNTGHL